MSPLIDYIHAVLGNSLAPETISLILRQAGRIVVTILSAHLLVRFLVAAVTRILESEQKPRFLDQARSNTLSGLLKSVVRYTVDTIAVLVILEQLGVPTGPMLAGAGVASLALGFGAQHLVRDFLAGFFILFEDQFSVGDYISAAGVMGHVEEMGLRITKIRDFSGELHTIPNGSLDLVTNYSQGPMRVRFNIVIPYGEDIDQAVTLMEETLQAAVAEMDEIVDAPTVLGVDELTSEGMVFVISGSAQPGTQWAATRALRQAVWQALSAAGIPAPYPRRFVTSENHLRSKAEEAGTHNFRTGEEAVEDGSAGPQI